MKKYFIPVMLFFLIVSLYAADSPVQDGLILVEGGIFQMGSLNGESHERPVHTVTVSSFFISPFEVTQDLWKQVMGSSIDSQRAKMKPVGRLRGKGDIHPMYYVNWYEAVEFCNNLSEIQGLDPCYSGEGEDISCDFDANGYRLPTEAEWEYAARGGVKSRGFLYAGSNALDVVAWYNGNSTLKTQEAGKKAPNELGLYDMSGNVYEWCWDRYDSYSAESQSDPVGSGTLSYRIFRGGSWSHSAEYSHNSFRIAYPPERRGNNLGFRMVRRHAVNN